MYIYVTGEYLYHRQTYRGCSVEVKENGCDYDNLDDQNLYVSEVRFSHIMYVLVLAKGNLVHGIWKMDCAGKRTSASLYADYGWRSGKIPSEPN